MLSCVAGLFFGFLGLLWWSYRRESRRVSRGGDAFAPPGKVRWGSDGR